MNQRAVSDSRVRKVSAWVADKPETTLWIALVVTLIGVLQVGDHVLGWW